MSLTKYATNSEGTEIAGLKFGLYWHSNFSAVAVSCVSHFCK